MTLICKGIKIKGHFQATAFGESSRCIIHNSHGGRQHVTHTHTLATTKPTQVTAASHSRCPGYNKSSCHGTVTLERSAKAEADSLIPFMLALSPSHSALSIAALSQLWLNYNAVNPISCHRQAPAHPAMTASSSPTLHGTVNNNLFYH